MTRYSLYILLLGIIALVLIFAGRIKAPSTTNPTVIPTGEESVDVVSSPAQSPSITPSPGLHLQFDFKADPQPEAKTYRLKEGDNVAILAIAPFPDEIHVHGYDLHIDLEPDKQASFQFAATKTGRFEMELENKHQTLGVLEVYPR